MTLEELVAEVARTGVVETTEEAAIKYQDLIAHASVEANRKLLNSNYTEAYIRVYAVAYGPVATVKYYLKNEERCSQVFGELEKVKEELKTADTYEKVCEKQIAEKDKEIENLTKIVTELRRDCEGMELNLEEKDMQIIKLKARLYDLEVKH